MSSNEALRTKSLSIWTEWSYIIQGGSVANWFACLGYKILIKTVTVSCDLCDWRHFQKSNWSRYLSSYEAITLQTQMVFAALNQWSYNGAHATRQILDFLKNFEKLASLPTTAVLRKYCFRKGRAQKPSSGWQYLRQRNTDEQIEKRWLMFKELTILQKLLIEELNRNYIQLIFRNNSYTGVTRQQLKQLFRLIVH